MDIKETLWQVLQCAIARAANDLQEQAQQMTPTLVGDMHRSNENSYAHFKEYGMPPATIIDGSAVVINEEILALPAPQQEA